MKHAVILAHPKPASFCGAIARAYVEAVRELGHDALLRDLYGMGFDPCLKAEEIPTPDGWTMGADVEAERRAVGDAQVFAFVYPFWFNAPPAILKGYVDRVFGMGFGYEPAPGGTTSLLDGRKLISFSTSGAPENWVRETGAMSALVTLFDSHLAGVTGLQVADHVHFGGITPGVTEAWVAQMLGDVREAARRAFGRAEAAHP